MNVMSDGCQPVEAAAEGGDAGYGHAAPGGHDGPTGINLGARAFAWRNEFSPNNLEYLYTKTRFSTPAHVGLRVFCAYRKNSRVNLGSKR
jgi:hypothetical protein